MCLNKKSHTVDLETVSFRVNVIVKICTCLPLIWCLNKALQYQPYFTMPQHSLIFCPLSLKMYYTDWWPDWCSDCDLWPVIRVENVHQITPVLLSIALSYQWSSCMQAVLQSSMVNRGNYPNAFVCQYHNLLFSLIRLLHYSNWKVAKRSIKLSQILQFFKKLREICVALNAATQRVNELFPVSVSLCVFHDCRGLFFCAYGGL